MKWTEILTAMVALYGAVVATFTAITQWRNARPRVKIEAKESYIIGFPSPGDRTDLVITVNPKNIGQKKVTLNMLGFTFPNQKGIVVPMPLGSVRFPYALEPESSCSMWIESKEMAENLHKEGITGKIKLVGYVTDAVGRQYKSQLFEFDADRWSVA